jgi:predicted glycosyltransferase involved in capsule biosynthesis
MIDLKDITFIIPVKLDSDDRRRNMKITLGYLQRNFDTNIIVCESDKESNEEFIQSCCIKPIMYMFDKDDTNIFHRTRILNEMTEASPTNIVVNYDIDVVFPIENYLAAREAINQGFDLVFPYGGPFFDIGVESFSFVNENKVNQIPVTQGQLLHPNSVGGAFYFNRERYRKAGLENENFLAWGFEDNERIVRLEKLGYKLGRVNGNCYHLTHKRDHNGWFSNPYIKQNEAELEKIKNMNSVDLQTYVDSWNWIK